MSFTYGFYNAINHDRKYDAIQMSQIFDGIINDGVYATVGNALTVSVKTDGGIVVESGRAWFNHTWNYNDTELPLNPPESDIVLDRYDAIVIDIRSDDMYRENSILWIQGTPSSNPTKPTMINEDDHWQHPLAYVYRAAGSTEINQEDITNTVGTSECPFVTGIIDTITTDQLVKQWADQWAQFVKNYEQSATDWGKNQQDSFEAYVSEFKLQMSEFEQASTDEFNEWFSNIQYVLDGDVAGHLQNEIDRLKEEGLSGSVITVSTPEETLIGKTVTLTGPETSKSGVFDTDGTVKFSGFMDVGNISIQSTDGSQTALLLNTIPYFGNYKYNLAFWNATVNISTSSEDLHGQVITITDSNESVVTTTAFSSAGTAIFNAIRPDTYTFSVTLDGETYSETLVVDEQTTYEITLDSKDFQVVEWIASSGSTKEYTTIAEVLADERLVRRLMTRHASVDYLAKNATVSNEDVIAIVNNNFAAKWITRRKYALDQFNATKSLKELMDDSGMYTGKFNAYTSYSFAQVQKILNDGKETELLNIGDTMSVTLSTGEVVDFQIGAINHDVEHEVIWVAKNCLAEGRQYHASDTNVGGWNSSDLRAWLNSTFYNQLPEGVKEYIADRVTKASAGNKSTSIVTSTDKIFLPREYEIFGVTTYAAATEATTGGAKQFPIFAVAANRIKFAGKDGASPAYWWESSPDVGNALSFCDVNHSGAPYTGGAASVTRAVPCFHMIPNTELEGEDYTHKNTGYIDGDLPTTDTTPDTIRYYETYGYKDNFSDLNAATRITYLEGLDNESYDPMMTNEGNGTATAGSWEDFLSIVLENKPGMFNKDGELVYWLDENDYTKKEDGTTSDYNNTSFNGGAFAWISRMYMREEYAADGNSREVEFASEDLEGFIPIGFEGPDDTLREGVLLPMGYMDSAGRTLVAGTSPVSSQTTAQEKTIIDNWSTGKADGVFLGGAILNFLRDLEYMLYKHTDIQKVGGHGRSNAYNGSSQYNGNIIANAVVANGNVKGFKGTASASKVLNKAFHSQVLFSYQQWLRDPYLLLVGGAMKVSPNYKYDISGDTYEATGLSFATSSAWFYPAKMRKASKKYGSTFVQENSGSTSTGYCDGGYWNNSGTRVAIRFGACNDDLIDGPAIVHLGDEATVAYWNLGVGLMLLPPAGYKPEMAQ